MLALHIWIVKNKQGKVIFNAFDHSRKNAISYISSPSESKATTHNLQADSMVAVNHDESTLRTFILFVQSAQSVLKYADSTLYRKANLSVIKLIVLRVLAGNSGGVTPSKLAEWTQTERHNITALVVRMRRDGLVKAERDKRDKSFVNISLIDKGLEVLNQTMPVAWDIVSHYR